MRWRSMRLSFRAAALLLAAAFSSPAFGESPLQQLQTDNLQLIWFHPAEDYLAPHAARSFENSLAFQKSLWGWKPDGKVTVLLKDFIDYRQRRRDLGAAEHGAGRHRTGPVHASKRTSATSASSRS